MLYVKLLHLSKAFYTEFTPKQVIRYDSLDSPTSTHTGIHMYSLHLLLVTPPPLLELSQLLVRTADE